MLNEEKNKQFVSELRRLMNKSEIVIFAVGKDVYFENEDMDIRVVLNEE